MKSHFRLSLATLLLLLLSSLGLHAQNSNKSHAQAVLKRTYEVMDQARNAVIKGKNMNGSLAQALNHQNYAEELMLAGKYEDAMRHAVRARMLAGQAAKLNGAVIAPALMKEDLSAYGGMKPASELDATLQKNQTQRITDDRDALNFDANVEDVNNDEE